MGTCYVPSTILGTRVQAALGETGTKQETNEIISDGLKIRQRASRRSYPMGKINPQKEMKIWLSRGGPHTQQISTRVFLRFLRLPVAPRTVVRIQVLEFDRLEFKSRLGHFLTVTWAIT